MRTRCPECGTVFRVTSEQLRLRAGKVRCGHCQAVFNAFDQLLPEEPVAEEPPAMRGAPEMPAEPQPAVVPLSEPNFFHGETVNARAVSAEPLAEAMPEAPAFDQAPDLSAASLSSVPVADSETSWPDSAAMSLQNAAMPDEPVVATSEIEVLPTEAEAAEWDVDVPLDTAEVPAVAIDEVPAVAFVEATVVPAIELPPVSRLPEAGAEESPEASTQAAREAGLVAARELAELQGYNRWAAGTLADSGLGGFDHEPARRTLWPFVLFSLLLAVLLLGQLAFHFRTELVQRFPSAGDLYAALAIPVPLPRNAELVAIDASDLQSDNQRGLFVLQATLRNRAPYAQAWPALELALTDTADSIVSRRVLPPADYLPPGTSPEAFPANGELAVRLWIEAKGIGAAGYRLYVFYP
jgi:predicted Zn finger-like uncharacterized protein